MDPTNPTGTLPETAAPSAEAGVTAPPDPRVFGISVRAQVRLVVAVLALYVGLMAATWPSAILIVDEAAYVGQSTVFAQGRKDAPILDRKTLERRWVVPSGFPVGTSAVQTPFVAAFGWRGAFVPSLLSLVAAVLLLLRWLSSAGRPPVFALVPLLFVGTSVGGRLAMSDEITLLIATGAWFAYFRSASRGGPVLAAAGFLAGASAVFRDVTPFLFALPFLMVVLRRTPGIVFLVGGGLAGVSLRLIGAKLMFGEWFFRRLQGGEDRPSVFMLDAVPPNVPLYLVILCVALPLGLPAIALFRDPRRRDVLLGVATLMALYLAFPLPHDANGVVRDVVLHARYVNALVPLAVYALSEWVPRLFGGRERLARAFVAVTGAGAVAVTLVVHLYLSHWGGTIARMVSAIGEHVPEGAFVMSSESGTGKAWSLAYGSRDWFDREWLPVDGFAAEVRKRGPSYVVFIDRTDAPLRVENARGNQAYLSEVEARCEVRRLVDRQESPIERLTIARVERCPEPPAP